MKLLQNKVSFLTGGSTGIGLDCAKAYAAEGANARSQAERELMGDAAHCFGWNWFRWPLGTFLLLKMSINSN